MPVEPRIENLGDDSVAALVAKCLERLEAEGESAIDAVCRENPQQATALRRSIAQLRAIGLVAPVGDGSSPSAMEPFPERLGDFRLLQRLGGGGMGIVYRAEQGSLGRQVALKLIRPEHLYFTGARERFRREVEAIAKLQHPGIVPVYACGEEGGIPYLAMELVKGATLAEVAADLAGLDPARVTGRDLQRVLEARAPGGVAPGEAAQRLFSGTWTAACLRIARQVAEALGHAHARGVLHRDVKPSNIMITPDGRALLLDFGLAATEGSERLTRTGSLLGSLAYMSPEQLLGAHDAVDARSDVYGLGVTLYELLALHAPYAGGSTEATRKLILDGQPQPLRARNPSVSRDAETVCLAAMERDAQRRYASAAAFSDDLGCVLELRPVGARRAGTWLRARRWAERRPAAAVSLAAGVLILVGGPLAYSLQQHHANVAIKEALAKERAALASESAALVQATLERDRAEANFGRARRAVDAMLTHVAGESLVDLPQMEGVRRELLEQALGFYEEFLAERSGDPELANQAADAAQRVGNLLEDLGRPDEALAALEQSRDLVAALIARSKSPDAELQSKLADVSWSIGQLESSLGHGDAAELAWQSALSAIEAARTLRPGNLQDGIIGYRIQMTMAVHHQNNGKPDEALRLDREAIASAAEIAARSPDDASVQSDLVTARNNLAMVLKESGRFDESVVAYRDTVVEAESLASRHPAVRRYTAQLGTIRMNLGGVLAKLKQYEESEAAYRAAMEGLEGVVARFPGYRDTRSDLATCAINLGVMLVNSKRPGDIDALYARAQELLETLVREEPEVVAFRGRLTGTLLNRADRARSQGNNALARELLESAKEQVERILAAQPDSPTWRLYRAARLRMLASVTLKLGDPVSAAAAARELVQPKDTATSDRRQAAGTLARCAATATDADSKRAYVEEALEILRGAVNAGFSDVADLRSADDLAALRDAPGFSELLAQIR